MPNTKTLTPDAARAAVTRLKEELAAAKVGSLKRQTAVETITATVGDRVLDARAAGDNGAEVAAQGELMAARTEAEVAAKIVDALGKRIEDAERDVLRADAHALRDEARRLWGEVSPRIERTARLLDELLDHEGVHVMPEPWVHPSGAFPSGSWKRTKTGDILAAIVDLERQAIGLEARCGLTSPPSTLAGVADAAWHLGHRGTIESAVPIHVAGSQLDVAADALRGKRAEPPDDGFASLRAELAQKRVVHRG